MPPWIEFRIQGDGGGRHPAAGLLQLDYGEIDDNTIIAFDNKTCLQLEILFGKLVSLMEPKQINIALVQGGMHTDKLRTMIGPFYQQMLVALEVSMKKKSSEITQEMLTKQQKLLLLVGVRSEEATEQEQRTMLVDFLCLLSEFFMLSTTGAIIF